MSYQKEGGKEQNSISEIRLIKLVLKSSVVRSLACRMTWPSEDSTS